MSPHDLEVLHKTKLRLLKLGNLSANPLVMDTPYTLTISASDWHMIFHTDECAKNGMI